tara:strand:+ start:662 stop:1255 length:594 start_codon:yes stop_codon:yes gene_type:complete
MTYSTINFEYFAQELNIKGPIESYIWEELEGNQWDSIESIVRQLEQASCSAGSWGDFIYTRDIMAKLGDSDWLDAIEQAVDDYGDATGESPDFTINGPFSLSNVVTFAVDWVAQDLAMRIRSFGDVALVTYAVDSLDTSPEVIAFASVSDAEEFVYDEVSRRVEHVVSHSPHAWDEADIDALHETELTLVHIEEESL